MFFGGSCVGLREKCRLDLVKKSFFFKIWVRRDVGQLAGKSLTLVWERVVAKLF